MLFLVRLKNRRIFSLRSLCLSCNTYDLGGIFFVPRLVDVEDGPLRMPYIEGEIWGSLPHTKLKEGMSSKINFAQFPREPSTTKSAPLHKGAIKCASCTPKRSASSQKSINDNAPRTPKRQERVVGGRRNLSTHRGTRLNQP